MAITLTNLRVWNTGERITLIIDADDERQIDASQWTLAPGFEDPHVHFRDPGQTYKEDMQTGCAAAASGGYTNVLIMPNTIPAMDGQPVHAGEPGAQEILDAGYDNVIDYLQHYEAIHHVKLPVHYELCVCATKDRDGLIPSDPQQWAWYTPGHDADKDASQIAHPVTAVSDDGSAVPESVLRDVLHNIAQTGLYLIEHCEHHDTGAVNDGPVARELGVPGIPEDTELNIVARDIQLARETGVHIHFQHVSTAIAFDAIRAAKAEGLPITCETAPHYIALCDEDLLTYGTLAKMNPPLRSRADRDAAIAAIADGTVDLIATDHAPHTLEEKQAGFLDAPNGIIGLECAYGVCHHVLVDGGVISDQRLIELMSSAPASLMGHHSTDFTALITNNGVKDNDTITLDLRTLDHPELVDAVILNTNQSWQVEPERFYSKARNTPFAHWQVTGLPMATILSSQLAFARW